MTIGGRARRAARALATAAVAAAILTGGGQAGRDRPLTGGAVRDDTAWLQARLDAGGGRIFLPKLPNGGCYATCITSRPSRASVTEKRSPWASPVMTQSG